MFSTGKMSWYEKGEEYEGNWVNGVQNGNGRYTWYSKRVAISQYPIRNEYEGEFVSGMRNGYGVFYYASGAKYAGEWKNNFKHGQGEFMFKNGSVFKGNLLSIIYLFKSWFKIVADRFKVEIMLFRYPA